MALSSFDDRTGDSCLHCYMQYHPESVLVPHASFFQIFRSRLALAYSPLRLLVSAPLLHCRPLFLAVCPPFLAFFGCTRPLRLAVATFVTAPRPVLFDIPTARRLGALPWTSEFITPLPGLYAASMPTVTESTTTVTTSRRDSSSMV